MAPPPVKAKLKISSKISPDRQHRSVGLDCQYLHKCHVLVGCSFRMLLTYLRGTFDDLRNLSLVPLFISLPTKAAPLAILQIESLFYVGQVPSWLLQL